MEEKVSLYIDSNETLNNELAIPQTNQGFGKNWLQWGSDNLYPITLYQMYLESSIHKAIINTKCNLAKMDKFIPGVKSAEFFIRMKKFGIDVNEIKNKSFFDLALFGGFALKVYWNVDGTIPVKLEYVPIYSLRTDDDFVRVYYSRDWRNTRKKNNLVEWFPIFDKQKSIDKQYNIDNPIQLYYYSETELDIVRYPTADYSGGNYDINTSIAISKFYNSYTENGMAPSYVITYPGVQEKYMKDLYEAIQNTWGFKNKGAGKFMLLNGIDKDKIPTITPIESDNLDKKFETLQKIITDNICRAHQINPVVAGVTTEGALGQRNELVEARLLFKQDFIVPKEQAILGVFNDILSLVEENDIQLLENNFENELKKL